MSSFEAPHKFLKTYHFTPILDTSCLEISPSISLLPGRLEVCELHCTHPGIRSGRTSRSFLCHQVAVSRSFRKLQTLKGP